MSTVQTHPTATARRSHARLLIAALVAVVLAAGAAVVTAGDNPTPTTFHLPSYALAHGGAPVPDLSASRLPYGPRYDGGPDEGTRGPTAPSSR